MLLLIQQAESVFSRLGEQYGERKLEAEMAVSKWRWANYSLFDLRPLHFEVGGNEPGNWIETEPDDPDGYVAYGMDADGRVRVERKFNKFGCYETFYNWGRNPVEIAHFDYHQDKRPINIVLALIRHGRVVEAVQSARGGCTHNAFSWDDSVVTEIGVKHGERSGGSLDPVVDWHTVTASYDDSKRLMRIEIHWPHDEPHRSNPTVELVFERRGDSVYRRPR